MRAPQWSRNFVIRRDDSLTALLREYQELLSEQFHYRELLLRMTLRDMALRYKQTAMGVAWAILMPLTNTAIFSIIFTRVARLDVDIPYPLFAYCGLWTWNLLASSLRFSVNSLTSNPNLITKVYFPREIFPFSAVLVSLVDFAVGALVLIALMIYYGVAPTGAILFLPVVLIVHLALVGGVALLLAMGNLFYRDVKYVFEIALMLWMFSTSVLYPLSAVGGKLGTIMRLNPATPIIDAYRDVLLRGELPLNLPFALASGISLVVFFGAWLAFHRAEFEFAEAL